MTPTPHYRLFSYFSGYILVTSDPRVKGSLQVADWPVYPLNRTDIQVAYSLNVEQELRSSGLPEDVTRYIRIMETQEY